MALLATALHFPPALAQVPPRPAGGVYPDASFDADRNLRNAGEHANQGQWAEAVEIYQRVILQFGDKVTKLPKDDPIADPKGQSELWVNIRQLCQRRIAALPPEARAIYRARVDSQAGVWYRQGAADRDRTLLRRVVEQAFCSSWGDDAIDLLGDLAFQDGRFAEALAAYRQLVPDNARDPRGLIHPDPSVDLARVAAKKLLCRAALGDDPPARADFDAFAQAFPDAKGALAGRRGTLLENLKEAVADDHLSQPAQADERWPTFAGSPARTRIAPGSIDVGSFQWKVDLELQTQPTAFRAAQGGFQMRMQLRAAGSGMSGTRVERPLAYYPIVLGDQVIVCDDKQVLAYNLNDRPASERGSSVPFAWKHENQPATAPSAARMYGGVPRYTLTAFGDRIYARLGPPGAMSARGGFGGQQGASTIVALDRRGEGKLIWTRASKDVELPARRPGSQIAGFEGSPVADAHSVYVALTEGGMQTSTYVACLDADTGDPRWVRFIHQSEPGLEAGMGMPFLGDMSHRLLTLDGSTVYYQTNLGAVAALDAETGQIRWLATYPRQEQNGSSHDRDLNPAIVHDGLVFVAPDDNPRIFAFDAVSGHLVWQTEPLEVTHVLGVARGRLIATGNQVFTIDAQTGREVRRWPDTKSNYEGFGRGLLAGNCIYWPTKTEIHILDQATGLPADRPPIKLQAMFQTTGGNLAVGDGYLVIAQPDALVVFCQNSRLIERYRDEIARAPEQAASHFHLAQAAEATNQDELALRSLATAIAKAKPTELVDGQPLLETARDHQFHLLMKLAARAASKSDLAAAARRYREAADAARADRDRLNARFRLADVQAEQGEPQSAVVTLQGLLADDRLRTLDVAADEHRTVRADLLITDRLNALLRKHGRELYAEFDRRADRLLERGKAEQDPRLLEEVGRSYPVARAVPAGLLAKGELELAQGKPDEAAQAYKRLLAVPATDSDRAQALWGLARAYEAQKLWVPARDTYLQALARFPEEPIAQGGGKDRAKLAALISERLGREPYDRMNGDRQEPSLPFPLVRRWKREWKGPVSPIGAEGVPPSARAGRIFLVERTSLRPLDPVSGESSWQTDLGDPPIWVGYLADRVIAATPTRLVALRLESGEVAWQTGQAAPEPRKKGLNPFARTDVAEGRPEDSAPGGLHDFRIVGNRIFCQRGDHELMAVDGDTGLVDWSFTPSSGQINPHVLIGPRRIVLQTRKPNTILVLDTASGRSRAEYAQGDDEEWMRDPFSLDDDHIAVVVDRRTVALFDLKRGMKRGDAVWTFRESALLPRNGPPRLLGDAERLLVLYDGTVLIRLDARTGLRLWAQPLGAEDLSDRPEALAFDGERFYCASGSTLTALALGDGARVWRRHLSGPDAGWSIGLTEHCLAAYPNPARAAEINLNDLPLVFCRRDTGGLVERLLFQTPVTELTVRLAPRYALVATQAGLWALGDRPGAEGGRSSPTP